MTSGDRRWMVFAAGAAAVLALAIAGYTYRDRPPALTDKDTIILADFANTTGDPVFDETRRHGLSGQLGQSPFLSVISDTRMQTTHRLMGQSADARLTTELAREICERTASARFATAWKAVLDGSIASLGSQYVLSLRARTCRTGDIIDEQQVEAARKDDVLTALTQIVRVFRTRVGESLATLETYETPLPEATTPSIDALKALSTGSRMNFSSGPVAAIPHVRRAIEIDPGCAMAHASLGLTDYAGAFTLVLAHMYLDRPAKAEDAVQRASERKADVTDLLILHYYLAFLRADRAGMDREMALAQGKPGAEDWLSHLESLVSAGSGQRQLARTISRRAVALAQQSGQKERAALFATGVAVREALSGNRRRGQKERGRGARALDRPRRTICRRRRARACG